MAEKHRPEVPDPARSYERAKPECEPGMGRLDDDMESPQDKPDGHQDASHRNPPSRQINAENDHSA